VKGYPSSGIIHANEGGRETTPPGAEIEGNWWIRGLPYLYLRLGLLANQRSKKSRHPTGDYATAAEETSK